MGEYSSKRRGRPEEKCSAMRKRVCRQRREQPKQSESRYIINVKRQEETAWSLDNNQPETDVTSATPVNCYCYVNVAYVSSRVALTAVVPWNLDAESLFGLSHCGI